MPAESFSDKHEREYPLGLNGVERIGSEQQQSLNLPTIYAQNRDNMNATANYAVNSPEAQAYLNDRQSIVHIKTYDSMASPTVANVTLGTGFFASADGTVVTDYHVIKNEKLGMTATTSDGQEHRAQVVAVDKAHDLALIRVLPNSPYDHFQPISLGSSQSMGNRENLTALGFPDDVLHVSPGTFSHYSRLSQYDLSQNGGLMSGEDPNRPVIETNNPVHTGDSGGPLITPDGKVAGVLDLAGDTRNFAVSTPIEDVKRLLAQNGVAVPSDAPQQALPSMQFAYGDATAPAQSQPTMPRTSIGDYILSRTFSQNAGSDVPAQQTPTGAAQNALSLLSQFANLKTIPGAP